MTKLLAVLAPVAICACGSKGGGTQPAPPSGTCAASIPHPVFLWTMPVAARQSVTLDATGSAAGTGGALTYTWSLVSRPQGSAAQLPGSGQKVTFRPDVGGAYAVSLSVSNSCGTNAVQVTVQVAEFTPTANAGPATDYAVPAGTIALDGSASSDLNGDPLTFSWAMTPPTGSAAAIANPSAAVTSFTPDVEGRYLFTLTVSDDTGRSSQSTTSIGVYHPAVALPVYPLDADYTAALDRILVATGEPALRIINPHDGTFASVALDAIPAAVRVAPDGQTAAVSLYGAGLSGQPHFAVVDLVTQRVTGTFQPSDTQWKYDGGDVVLDGRGYAYAFPQQGISASPLIVNLATGGVTTSATGATAESSVSMKPVLDSSASNLYMLGFNAEGLVRAAMTAGSLTYSTQTQQSGTTSLFAGPFLADGGARLFTGDGQIWSPSTLASTGSLLAPGDTSRFTWIADSAGAGKIIAVKGGDPYGDDAFRLYDRSSLTLLEKKFWPGVIAGGVASWGTVQWAFWKADGSGYYIVFNRGIAEY